MIKMNLYENMIQEEFSASQTYMYTRFCGIDFIKAYFQSRQKEIEKLRDSGSGILEKPETYLTNKLKSHYSGQVFSLPSKAPQKIDSLQALLSLALLPAEGGQVPDETVKWWVNRFVQRFEISKRICDSYSCAWKRLTEEHQNIFLYALLSYICAWMYEKTLNYKYLNCALKINDFLVHVGTVGLKEDEIQFVVVCLEREIRLVEKVCQESGVFSYGA